MPRRCATAWIVALLVGLAVGVSPIAESRAAAAGVAGSPTASNNVTKWANIANAYSASDGAAAASWNAASSCWNGWFWYTCPSTSTVNFTTFGFDSSVPAGLTNLSATLELRTALTYLNLFASGSISMQAQVWNGSSWVNTGSSTYRSGYGAFNTYYTDSVTVTGLTSSQLSDSNFRVAVNGSSNGVGFGMLMDYVRVTVQDATAPTAGTVNDGSSSDVNWQTSTSSIQANWSGFSDSWPGIASYDYAIGTTSGGTEVKSWTSVGTATSVTASSLALSDGTTYFVSVRATDSDGNVSSVATSNGVTVDTTAPTPGTVNDGMGADIDWQNSTSTIQANWSGFSDATSGIASYDYAIGTTAGGTDISNWTSNASATNVTNSSLGLVDGTTYFVSVRATDSVGNVSSVATSNGVTVETTAPTPGTVNDGMGADIDWQNSTSTIQANWSGFSDATSGIASYDYAIGTTAGGTDISNWTSNASATNVTNSSLGLADGTTYFVSVRATDTAGNTSTVATSNGVTVDITAPTVGTVNDGSSSDVDWQTSTSNIQANWSGFSDSWPGIASYDYAIGTTAGGTQVKSWTSVGTAASMTASSLVLSDGTTYFVSVRANDTAGNVSTVATSNGVTVDTTAPTPGTVNDGTTSDITWQNSTSTMQANWSGFSDATSGIASYDYAIGTTAGGTQVKSWTSVGTATSVTASSLALSDGTKYYLSVRATDSVGNVSSVATSNGVTVDTTAPTAGTVSDGMGADIDWQTGAEFNANWSGFSDTDSGIAEYRYAIGTTTGGTDVQPWTSVGVATSASSTSATFVVGTVYYLSVRAVDQAGNVRRALDKRRHGSAAHCHRWSGLGRGHSVPGVYGDVRRRLDRARRGARTRRRRFRVEDRDFQLHPRHQLADGRTRDLRECRRIVPDSRRDVRRTSRCREPRHLGQPDRGFRWCNDRPVRTQSSAASQSSNHHSMRPVWFSRSPRLPARRSPQRGVASSTTSAALPDTRGRSGRRPARMTSRTGPMPAR